MRLSKIMWVADGGAKSSDMEVHGSLALLLRVFQDLFPLLV